MSAQHTTGPWNRGFGNYVYQGEHKAPGQRLIAVCEPTARTREDWDETFANAKLIAAAPELLAALQLYLAHASEPECAIWRHVQQKARAAIAKATD
jgi:hypothetical protein